MPYAYTNTRGITYYLHQDWVTLRGHAAPRPVYYFRREPGEHAIEAVPEGYEIYEGARRPAHAAQEGDRR
jgi:hypothetical protein